MKRRGIWRVRNLVWFFLPLLLWWSLREAPLREIERILRSLSLGAILTLAGLNVFILLLLTGRWWLILKAQNTRVRFPTLLGYRLAAFGISYFTPGPQFGGEPLQVYLLEHRAGISSTGAIASVALDKILELSVNFAFLLVGLMTAIAGDYSAANIQAELILPVLALLALPCAYLAALSRGWLPVGRLLGRLRNLTSRFTALKKAHLSIVASEYQVAQFCSQHPRTILLALGISIFSWFVIIFEYWMAFRFLALPIGLSQTIIALTAARIAFLLPAPSGLGTLEASQVIAMGILGFSPALGISISLLIRARDVTLAGIGLWLCSLLVHSSSADPLPAKAGD